MKKERFNMHEESAKKEWNAPEIIDLDVDSTENGFIWATKENTVGYIKSS